MEEITSPAIWENLVDEYSALHGVFGMYVGLGLCMCTLSQEERIITLLVITCLFELFEYYYFKKLVRPTDTLSHAVTDIAIGFVGGWMVIQQHGNISR